MLRRLRVRGYKSLADCTVDFEPATVLLGPNGAGKSNLLDLIGLMSRMASRETLRESFEGHRGRPLEAFYSKAGFSKASYEAILEQDRISFTVACDLEIQPRIVEEVNAMLAEREQAGDAKVAYTRVSETLLRYTLQISLRPKSGELVVADERLQALRQDLEPKAASSRMPFIELSKDNPTGKPRFVARIERQSHPRYFEPDRPRTLLSELTDPVYHPHVVAAAKEIASWRVYYVEPTRMRREVPVQAADDPGRHGDLLAAFYYSLQQRHPTTLKGIVRNLRELVPGLENLRVDVREGLLEIVTIHAGGAEFPARLLSEGTLRLMCLLGISVAPMSPSIVVYEEPENGVNPARLDLIAQIVKTAVERGGRTQFIMTTHSPLLCNMLPDHLLVSTWDAKHGTTIEKLSWDPGSLYFDQEIVRAIDGLMNRAPHDWPQGVSERPEPRE
jgi:predicted ATPase